MKKAPMTGGVNRRDFPVASPTNATPGETPKAAAPAVHVPVPQSTGGSGLTNIPNDTPTGGTPFGNVTGGTIARRLPGTPIYKTVPKPPKLGSILPPV